MSKVNLITPAEYAKHRGQSKAAVSKAIKAGRISLIDGKIDPVAADAQWARNSRVRAGSGKPPAGLVTGPLVGGGEESGAKPGGDDYWVSRSRREAADAGMAEIELAEKAGQVIQVKAVEAVWSSACAAMREHLLQVRSRLAPMLAVESDPFVIDQMLDAEHSAALEFMATADVRPKGVRS